MFNLLKNTESKKNLTCVNTDTLVLGREVNPNMIPIF